MKQCLFAFALCFPIISLAQSVDQNALDNLVTRAKETNSTALVVYQNDKLILNQCFDTFYIPIDAMSATKSFVNLAIGLLITQGHLKSIDEPVYKFYPEWNQDLKKEVTIRHLLNHTSGIQSQRNAQEIYASNDYVELALKAAITDQPGSKFFYNNKAVNLLAGIVQKASGVRMDEYMHQHIFEPLGIKNYSWLTDAFMSNYSVSQDSAYLKKGNPIGMAELMIKADDMAKVGLLVLHKGSWNGKQIIAESWFDESMKPGQDFNRTCGLLWWLLYDPGTSYVTFDESNLQKVAHVGLNDTILHDLSKIKGLYKNEYEFLKALDTLNTIKKLGGGFAFKIYLFGKSFFDDIYTLHTENSTIVGFAARGFLGQRMNIFPHKKLVVVRTIRTVNSKTPDDNFFDFDLLSYALVK